MAATEMERRLVQLENSLSERLARVEEQVSQLAQQVSGAPSSPETPWWKTIVGVFHDDPEFEAAMQLGRAYRESLPPSQAEDWVL
jgi:hypothetical protein